MLLKKIKMPGFTMIELLVVIAVIGVLAVAVLSSINPLEQINKGRDTKKRSDAAQILNAIDRYYASQEEYPFDVQAVADGGLHAVNTELANSLLKNLVDTKEIKKGFKTRLVNDASKPENHIYIYVDPAGAQSDGDVEGVYACFKPSSNSFKKESAKHAADWSFVEDEINNGNYYICLP